MTVISQEDKNSIDNFFDKLETAFTTGTEITLAKIGDCVSRMPLGDLQNLGNLVKKYGYYGAFFAIQQSVEENDFGPIGKYALATAATIFLTPLGATIGQAAAIAYVVGSLTSLAWDYIEEHKDDILEKIKQLLSEEGVEISEERFQCELPAYINVCPILKEKTICEIKDLFETAEETRSPLVLDLDGDGIETITADGGVYFDHDGNLFQERTAWVAKDDALLVKDIRLAA